MKSIIILIALLLLSGCSTSNSNLLEGELYIHQKQYTNRTVIQTIGVDEDEFYSIKVRFH